MPLMADTKYTTDTKPHISKLHPDYIEQYSIAGYALFELNGKRPKKKGANWQDSINDPKLTLLDLPGNFGVVIPSSILIIDVDCKHGQKGKESYNKLICDCGIKNGWESKTFVVKTGSGGFHVYLSKPPDLKTVKKIKYSVEEEAALDLTKEQIKEGKYPGIDFLSLGCYVVGAGSIHPDTALRYEVVFGSPSRVEPAPPSILDKLEKTIILTDGEKPEDYVDDDPLNIERYVEILELLPGASKGGIRNSCYIAACRGRDLGLTKVRCRESLWVNYNPKLNPPLDDREMDQIVNSAYNYAQGKQGAKNVSSIFETVQIESKADLQALSYDMTANNIPKTTLNNAVNYLATIPDVQGMFKYNCFTGNVEIESAVPWFKQRGSNSATVMDEDVILLKYHISRTMKVEFSVGILLEAIIVSAHKRHYHPIQGYLSSLKWDSVPRLDTWLIRYGGATDTPYIRAAGRKTLCAAVKRVFDPGCKWDYVLIIEGAQGIGKSTTCRILGRLWGGDMNLDPHSKDAVAMMAGKWIIELSEMVALKWADAAALKSFITRQKDTVRAAYARHAKDYLRQSIFIGTVNPEHVGYLHDVTGNRRFWIINFPGMVKTRELEQDCEQLWAEAVVRYKHEPLYLNNTEEQLQVVEAKARMPEDPLRRHVAQYIKENPTKTEFDIVDLMGYVGIPATRANKADQGRLAQALVDLGCIKERVVVEGEIRSVFKRGKK